MCNRHYLQCRSGIIDEQGRVLRDFKKRARKGRWAGREGYVLVPAPDGHPHARVDGSILEHRLVMEQHLGRPLEEHEIVHHKDGKRWNNYIENLELMDGRSRKGRGHPPSHSFDVLLAIQVILQQDGITEDLRSGLADYRNALEAA